MVPKDLGTLLFSNTPLQVAESPSWDAKCFAFAEERAFVSMSAVMSSVGE